MATIAIFLPAFILVALVGPLADRVRDRPLTAALLDGVNASALGLMAAVTLQLGVSAVPRRATAVVLIGSAVAVWWGRIPSVALVGIGAAIGLGAGSRRHRSLTYA